MFRASILALVLSFGLLAAPPCPLSPGQKIMAESMSPFDIAGLAPPLRHRARSIAWMDYFCIEMLERACFQEMGMSHFRDQVSLYAAVHPGCSPINAYRAGLQWAGSVVLADARYVGADLTKKRYSWIEKANRELPYLE